MRNHSACQTCQIPSDHNGSVLLSEDILLIVTEQTHQIEIPREFRLRENIIEDLHAQSESMREYEYGV